MGRKLGTKADADSKKMSKPRGGARVMPPGAGRVGIVSLKRKAEIIAYESNGTLNPHEWLKQVMDGAGVEQVFRDVQTGEFYIETCFPGTELRMEAAKAAAQYYAPKLVSQKIDASVRQYEDMTDEELAAKLESARE